MEVSSCDCARLVEFASMSELIVAAMLFTVSSCCMISLDSIFSRIFTAISISSGINFSDSLVISIKRSDTSCAESDINRGIVRTWISFKIHWYQRKDFNLFIVSYAILKQKLFHIKNVLKLKLFLLINDK